MGRTAFRVEKWHVLAFMAGTINVGGFMACDRFVSHVTGFASLFGVYASVGDWSGALSMMSVPAFFLFGGMISALFTEVPESRGRRPRYDLVFLFEALLLLSVAVFGHFHFFGLFGDGYLVKHDFLFLAMLCCATGLQNAAVTTLSRSTMRSTHLTGLTTDLGIGIIRSLCIKRGDGLAGANGARIAMVVFFSLGGVLGALMFRKIDYLGFAFPGFLAASVSRRLS